MRAIDADKAIEVAQIKYNDWNLAMAAADGQREINLCFKKQELFKAVKAVLDCVPTLTPPNEPLTLEELREMDGEPVWCEWLLDADRRIESGAWFIVVVGEYGLELKKPLDFGCYVCKNENYETEWLAYRRPPEGGEDTRA